MYSTLTSRLAQGAVLLILMSAAVFALVRLAPGDPAVLICGPSVAPAEVAQLRDRWGLDAPIHVQYFAWLVNFARGDFGRSYVDGRPVLEVIGERVPATLTLAGTALLIAAIGGTALGLYCGMRRGSVFDRAAMAITSAMYSTPPFWLGILLIFLFGARLGWLPTGGLAGSWNGESAGGYLAHLALPAIALATRDFARFARVTRASVLEVSSQEYVRAATAKGLTPFILSSRHVMTNALLPVITLLGTVTPGLLGGAVVVEMVFSWPGMGRLMIESAMQRNYPVILGEVLFTAALALLGSLIADLACVLADPRLRHGRQRPW